MNDLNEMRKRVLRTRDKDSNVTLTLEEVTRLIDRVEAFEGVANEAEELLNKMDAENLEAFGISRDDLQDSIRAAFAKNATGPMEVLVLPEGAVALNGVQNPDGTIKVNSIDFVDHQDAITPKRDGAFDKSYEPAGVPTGSKGQRVLTIGGEVYDIKAEISLTADSQAAEYGCFYYAIEASVRPYDDDSNQAVQIELKTPFYANLSTALRSVMRSEVLRQFGLFQTPLRLAIEEAADHFLDVTQKPDPELDRLRKDRLRKERGV